MSAWDTLWWGRSESHVPSLSFSAHRDLSWWGPSPLLCWKEVSPSCTPSALLPPSLLPPLSPGLASMPSHVSCWARPHPGPLTACALDAVAVLCGMPPLPPPRRPHPFQKLCGGAGGQGHPEPPGWRGTGDSVPCFLLLLTNPPFLCLDFDLSEETVGFTNLSSPSLPSLETFLHSPALGFLSTSAHPYFLYFPTPGCPPSSVHLLMLPTLLPSPPPPGPGLLYKNSCEFGAQRGG